MVGAKMTASELANLLEVDSWYKLVTREEIATMLRQQQAEIEALKQIIDANNLNQNIGQFVKPTNEPVAWTDGKGNYFDKNSFFPVDDPIPLYTHPVKELTDEEIIKVYEDMLGVASAKGSAIDFARAILRKA
jgi:hypothetical protein